MSRPRNHAQTNLRGIDVDVGIAPLLAALWDAGYETYASCENFRNGGARIWFAAPEGRDVIHASATWSADVTGDGYAVEFFTLPDQFITTSTDIEADPYEGLSDEVKKRLGASRGVPKSKLLEKAKIHGRDMWHSVTRHRPFLEPEEQATVADILRTHQDTPDNAVRRAMQVLQGIVGGMKPKQYEIFTLHLLMQDMLRDIDSGLANRAELPFGFTEDEARDYSDYLSNLVDNDPVIKGAVTRRRNFQEKMKKALVEADLLPKAVLEDDRYFHHQVLKYKALEAMGEAYKGLGVGSDDVRLKWKGWQIDRAGSIEDYNTDYVQAEFEIISASPPG